MTPSQIALSLGQCRAQHAEGRRLRILSSGACISRVGYPVEIETIYRQRSRKEKYNLCGRIDDTLFYFKFSILLAKNCPFSFRPGALTYPQACRIVYKSVRLPRHGLHVETSVIPNPTNNKAHPLYDICTIAPKPRIKLLSILIIVINSLIPSLWIRKSKYSLPPV